MLQDGIYAGLLGPAYETPAEVRGYGRSRGDAVGMSTVLEAITCRWAGIEIAGVSLVTNPGFRYSEHPSRMRRFSPQRPKPDRNSRM